MNTLRLASWNTFCGFGAIGVVPSCLAPGLRNIKAEDYCVLGVQKPKNGLWID